ESKNEMKITANGGDVDLTGATADSNNKITVTASGAFTAQDATLESENEMKITANGGDVDLSGSKTISNNKITLTSSADINLRNAEIQAQNIKASPASSGALFVNDNGGNRADGGTYIENKNGQASDISLQQGTVDGTPEKGSIN
ncbi:hemagglutinin repeat-containing protein, partial [Halorubrum ezzemoulense]|uniref:hemagglutinin repeat-containing protein n=1 Tax=Halorubrum ezzemoulense TaxID=337243 RepID=UPI00232C55EA